MGSTFCAPLLGAAIYTASSGSFRTVYWCQAALALAPLALVLVFVPRSLGRMEPTAQSTKVSTQTLYVYREHGGLALLVTIWGVCPMFVIYAYSVFVFPLTLVDAGVDPALINVIDAFLPFVSAFVIISTAVMVDRWRFGVRICAAGYGGLMGETLFMLGRSALKTDSSCCCGL